MRDFFFGVLLALGIIGGYTVATEEQDPTARSPQFGAVQICEKPETKVFLVQQHGIKHWQAQYENDSVRYDLTWQIDGNVIAVEELRTGDSQVVPSVETMSDEFQACVARKNVTEVNQN